LETRIPLLSLEEEQQLFGPHDRHVKQLAKRLQVRVSSRGGTLRLQGPEDQVVPLAERLKGVLAQLRAGREMNPSTLQAALLGETDDAGPDNGAAEPRRAQRGRMPEPRTPTQREYVDLMQTKELVFATGPAGTGKTYLAVAAAVRALRDGLVSRLVLTRPAVEAGERLGFLPGDLEDKIDPYLRPLYDALNDLLGPASARRMKEMEMIEVAPLAFMRGRTLNRSFVILDEAQNATRGQLKMFLTRLGEGTRAVVTGDVSQTDLPGQQSGLLDAMRRLDGIEGIGTVTFAARDVQRSKLVQRIVQAYGDDEQR
jgi:phosphate starvation-inducible PhoH-like protein